jgi:hypothetical protein
VSVCAVGLPPRLAGEPLSTAPSLQPHGTHATRISSSSGTATSTTSAPAASAASRPARHAARTVLWGVCGAGADVGGCSSVQLLRDYSASAQLLLCSYCCVAVVKPPRASLIDKEASLESSRTFWVAVVKPRPEHSDLQTRERKRHRGRGRGRPAGGGASWERCRERGGRQCLAPHAARAVLVCHRRVQKCDVLDGAACRAWGGMSSERSAVRCIAWGRMSERCCSNDRGPGAGRPSKRSSHGISRSAGVR